MRSEEVGMPRRYPPLFRRKVLDLIASGRKVADVAHDLGVSGQTIYNWRKQDLIDRGERPGRHCCIGPQRRHQGDSRDEITRVSSCPTSAQIGLRRVPLPARGHHPGGPLVSAVRSFLSRRRGAPGGTRHRGRPRHDLPVGPALRPRSSPRPRELANTSWGIAGTRTRPISR